MREPTDPFRFYVHGLLGLLTLALAGVFTVNAIVDPLWHFRGNRLHDISYRFEERAMKLNYFLNHADEYDCLIFGASRATLLDESLIEGADCYNMAFSLGHVREFVLIADYLRSRGFVPERVIVSVDEISFQPRAYTDGEKLPEYVRTKERPKWSIEDYLGKTPLRFSVESILRTPAFIRAYHRREDGSYRGILQPTERTYRPERNSLITPQHVEPFDESMLEEFEDLREVFPDAEFLAYVSPISDWLQARMDLTGNLERYIGLRYELAEIFDGNFWDLSIPNRITADTTLTFDGEHYDESVNRDIARCLNGERDKCGAEVRSLTLDEYRELILPPIRSRIGREGLTVTLSTDGNVRWADDV